MEWKYRNIDIWGRHIFSIYHNYSKVVQLNDLNIYLNTCVLL